MSDLKLYRILETFDNLDSATDKLAPVTEEQVDEIAPAILAIGTAAASGAGEGFGKGVADNLMASKGDNIDRIIQAQDYEGIRDQDGWETLELTVRNEQEPQAAEAIMARLQGVEESNTRVQNIGNKVRVTTDGDTTEFDDAETASAMMGAGGAAPEDDNQFATEDKETDDEDADRDIFGLDDEDDDYNDTDVDESKEEVQEGILGAQELGDQDWGDDEEIEYSTFDANNEQHRKRLQQGTPVVLSPEIMSNPNGDRTGIFVSRSPSGHFGTVIRNVDQKEINVHLSDIVSADITNNSIYEEYGINFDKLLAEDITITQTTNPSAPENDTTTVTAVGPEAADELSAMMANAGLNTGEYAPAVDTGEPGDIGAPEDAGAPVEMGRTELEPLHALQDPAMEEGYGDEYYDDSEDTAPVTKGPSRRELDSIEASGEEDDLTFDLDLDEALPDDGPSDRELDDIEAGSFDDEEVPEFYIDEEEVAESPRVASRKQRFEEEEENLMAGADRIHTSVEARGEAAIADRQERMSTRIADRKSAAKGRISARVAERDSAAEEPALEGAFGSDDELDAQMGTRHDAEGNNDENGSYDAGGNYDAEHAANNNNEDGLEEERDTEHANSPRELIAKLDAIINGTSGGLNKPKNMYKPVAGGDNAMQRPMHESKYTKEELESELKGLEAKGGDDKDDARRVQIRKLLDNMKEDVKEEWEKPWEKEDKADDKEEVEEVTEAADDDDDKCPHCGADLAADEYKDHVDSCKENDDSLKEDQFVNEHESVDNFLSLYKEFSVRGEKK